MTEVWKIIEDYPNYSVSNLGRVRNNKTGRIIKAVVSGGRKRYRIYSGKCFNVVLYPPRKTFKVHRLVAMAFIPNPDNKTEVNQKDGNRLNNFVSNLEWVTGSENILHAYRTLNRKMGDVRSKKVIRVEDGCIFESISEAANLCGIKSISNVCDCIHGRRSTAGGYHWQYYEQEAL